MEDLQQPNTISTPTNQSKAKLANNIRINKANHEQFSTCDTKRINSYIKQNEIEVETLLEIELTTKETLRLKIMMK